MFSTYQGKNHLLGFDSPSQTFTLVHKFDFEINSSGGSLYQLEQLCLFKFIEDCTIFLKKLTAKYKSEFNVLISTTVAKYIEQFCFSIKRVYLIPVRKNEEEYMHSSILI